MAGGRRSASRPSAAASPSPSPAAATTTAPTCRSPATSSTGLGRRPRPHRRGPGHRTEVGDEESYYEVEVTLDDGTQVDVQLDRDFQVVGSSADLEEADGADDWTVSVPRSVRLASAPAPNTPLPGAGWRSRGGSFDPEIRRYLDNVVVYAVPVA